MSLMYYYRVQLKVLSMFHLWWLDGLQSISCVQYKFILLKPGAYIPGRVPKAEVHLGFFLEGGGYNIPFSENLQKKKPTKNPPMKLRTFQCMAGGTSWVCPPPLVCQCRVHPRSEISEYEKCSSERNSSLSMDLWLAWGPQKILSLMSKVPKRSP